MSEKSPPTESELVDFVRSIDVPAPPELLRRIDAMVAARPPARRRRQLQLRFGATAALAAAVIALALVIAGSGGGSTLTLHTAVALTQRPATMPAPAESANDDGTLVAHVEDVAFPYWEDRGWRATGARLDRAGGRMVTTVFYHRGHGQWVGYAIVAGTRAPSVSGGVVIERGGVPYRFTVTNGVKVMTWLRDGHLCVVAGHGVSNATLLSLASEGARAA
ncbi:MAG TPA: hypothetical protein VK721_09175 [Solirubrobacteraceae bacterium]|jgi:hypothetical protein|nr:hypothetical protein [Solirubrobacteraceae bacterium]